MIRCAQFIYYFRSRAGPWRMRYTRNRVILPRVIKIDGLPSCMHLGLVSCIFRKYTEEGKLSILIYPRKFCPLLCTPEPRLLCMTLALPHKFFNKSVVLAKHDTYQTSLSLSLSLSIYIYVYIMLKNHLNHMWGNG